MAEEVTKKKTIVGFLWRFAERCGAQGVSFVVTIILARLLSPNDYGTVALISIFLTIMNVFIDSGMSISLVQKKNVDDLDYSTVFFFNLFMCVLLYLIMCFCAPLIANFYDKPELVSLTRVSSITLIVAGVRGVQSAYVSKHLIFKKFFFSTLGGTIFSAVLGIFMAYKGFGPWAIVAQTVSNSVIDTCILWITVKWRPKWMFSFKRLKGLFSFGWKLLVSSLLDTGYNQLRSLIIGKVYSSADLAFYDKAKSFPNIIVSNINASIDSVLLPTMSSVQDSKESVKAMTRRAMKTSTYTLAPLLLGLACCSEPLISLLLTDKWLPSYPYTIIFCITYVFYPINTANLNAIKAMGRSDLFLKLEIIKKGIGLVVLIIAMRISVMAIAVSLLIASILGVIINSYPNKKLINYSYLEQIKDVFPGFFLSGIMGLCVWSVTLFNFPSIITLLIQVPLGGIIYIGLSALFKLESFTYCLNTAKPILNKFLKKGNK